MLKPEISNINATGALANIKAAKANKAGTFPKINITEKNSKTVEAMNRKILSPAGTVKVSPKIFKNKAATYV